MRFDLSKDKKNQLILKANGTDLQDRWVLHNLEYFMKNELGNSTTTFANAKPVDTKLRKTCLTLCEDDILQRTVLVKTVKYENADLNDPNLVRLKRRALGAQVDILNNIASNMLPEPLDFFLINNTFDKFTGEAKQLQSREPVLVLDFFPGEVLADKLNNNRDKSFYRTEDGKSFSKSTEIINVGIVMRLIGDILAFEMELYDKGYAYTALSPDHIVLLGDNKPRFVGIGRICPIEDDKYDREHINFGRQLRGFSAPEFNTTWNNYGETESVKAAIAYNIGTLIASIMLGRSDFDERYLRNGSYNYAIATEDREEIKKAFHGVMIDTFLCRLTNDNLQWRLTDFSEIFHELAIISGDEETVYYGRVKFFHYSQIDRYRYSTFYTWDYGYVTCNGKDYYADLSKMDYVPEIGDGNQEGLPVSFTARIGSNGKRYVKEFIRPKSPTEVKWPQMVKKPKPVVVPVKPKPQPVPKPSPQPQLKPAPAPSPQPVPAPDPQPQPVPQPPKKKGFFARLFGL